MRIILKHGIPQVELRSKFATISLSQSSLPSSSAAPSHRLSVTAPGATAAKVFEILIPLRSIDDAQYYLRSYSKQTDLISQLRRLLAAETVGVHRLDDDEVLRQIAQRIVQNSLHVVEITWQRPSQQNTISPPPPSAIRGETQTLIQPLQSASRRVPLPTTSSLAHKSETNGQNDLQSISQHVPLPATGPFTHKSDANGQKDNLHWIEIILLGEDGEPILGEEYEILLPTGKIKRGNLDGKGMARIDDIPEPGVCHISFPKLDQDAWERLS